MDLKDFINELIDRLHDRGIQYVTYREEGFTSDDENELSDIRVANLRYYKKESDSLLGDFLRIETNEDRNHICRFECAYLKLLYDEEGWERVMYEVDENIKAANRLSDMTTMQILEENDYEKLKEHLIIRPLNFADHKYEFKDKIYRRFGDIALVLYVLINDSTIDGNHDVYSVKISREQTVTWGASEDEIWEAALMNTYLLAPPRMYLNPKECVDPPYQLGAFMAIGSKMTSLKPSDVPIVTTTRTLNGAIAMFYPGVKERIAEMYGSDYYVVFTGISDVRLHKVGTIRPVEALRRLKQMNKAFSPEETLSRKIYLYKKESAELVQMEL